MADFAIKQGDLLPELSATLKDGAGTAVDLTGGTVKFSMRLNGATANKVSAAAASIVEALTGRVKYTWAGTDTDTPGRYDGEFEVTLSGKKMTFPNAGHLEIIVTDDLG